MKINGVGVKHDRRELTGVPNDRTRLQSPGENYAMPTRFNQLEDVWRQGGDLRIPHYETLAHIKRPNFCLDDV